MIFVWNEKREIWVMSLISSMLLFFSHFRNNMCSPNRVHKNNDIYLTRLADDNVKYQKQKYGKSIAE